MSYPRRKLDLDLLILEAASCAIIEKEAKRRFPHWDFNRFEAANYGNAEMASAEHMYEPHRVLSWVTRELNELDEARPFLLPLERGTHYAWELFVELPRVGGSCSTHQFWNRLARVMSELTLPLTAEELVDYYEKALLYLLQGATDMGDRFYLSDIDFGGWNGGIVSKDFLVEGLKMLVTKLDGPLCERSIGKKREAEEQGGENDVSKQEDGDSL